MPSPARTASLLLLAAPAAAQTDYVQYATVEVSHQHIGNQPLAVNPYFLELWLKSDSPVVTDVVVQPPAATGLASLLLLPDGPGLWMREEVPFAGGFLGGFQFGVYGGALLDSLAPVFNPGPTGSLAFVTSPAPGALHVSTTPTFTWNAVSGWPAGATIGIEMYDVTADQDLPPDTLALTATSWTPAAALAPDHYYQFEIGVSIEAIQGALSGGGAPYAYHEIYSETNSIFFATCVAQATAQEIPRAGTPPNPLAFLQGVTSPPIVGKTWDPVVDHSAFMPSAALDFLAISSAALNVSTAFGTLLCAPPPPGLIFTRPAGQPFEIPVPVQCNLIGAAVYSQAASLDAAGNIALTNALDLVVGSS